MGIEFLMTLFLLLILCVIMVGFYISFDYCDRILKLLGEIIKLLNIIEGNTYE